MFTVFRTTYICKCPLSIMKQIKSKKYIRLTNESLSHLFCVLSSDNKVDSSTLI